MTSRVTALVVASLSLVASVARAQNAPRDTTPAVGGPTNKLPLKPTRVVRFTTDEGTWVSLDVSPDGRTIVFELLGDLYTMPITGGKATRITDGPQFDWAPRYSPDGRSILFVSDRSGTQNLWTVDANGAHPRAITNSPTNQYMSPEWAPDGQYVVVSQAARRFAPYELFLIDLRGGSGVKISTASTSHVGLAFGADPRYVYYSTGGGFGSWQVHQLDRRTGRSSPVTSARGGGLRPVLSPDGRYLVYATRRDAATVLMVRDLQTGDQHVLVPEAARDEQERLDLRDLMPGSSFTPDSKALITSYGGKIWRVEVPSGQATVIPFTADVEQHLGPLVLNEVAHNDSVLTVRQIRDAHPSPDGRRLVFSAISRVWIADLGPPPQGAEAATIRNARRLTSSSAGEFEPVWSPDGQYVAFVSWDEREGGAVQRVRVAGGAPETLTRDSAFYATVNYTPDGSRLVAVRAPRELRYRNDASATGPNHSLDLVMLPASGGENTLVSPLSSISFPHFSADTGRVFLTQNGELISMRMDGTDRRSHLKVTGRGSGGGAPPSASKVVLSPTGDRAAALVENNIFVVSVPPVGGQTLTINAFGGSVPARRVSRIGGEFPGWSADGKELYYSIGKSYFRYDVAAAETAVRDSIARAEAAPAGARPDTSRGAAGRRVYEPARYDIVITVPKDKPKGVVAFRGARIITMKGKEIIENGDLVVQDNRILAVGRRGSVQIPKDVRVIDVAGKTIMPGWVDVHAHMWSAWDIHRSQVWQYLANLAYGITTTRDPQTSTSDIVTYGDLVEAGTILGPRVYGTGVGVGSPSGDDIRSLDDARDILRRYSEFWQTETIKQYSAGDRRVRQWIIMAAKELGLMVTTEGSGEVEKDLTVLMDGYTGQEHNFTVWPMFKDMVEITAQSGITYTPTLLVNYNAPQGEDFFFTRNDVHDDAKLRRFTPHADVDAKTLRRSGWGRDDQYVMRSIAADAAKILAAGGRIGLGGHGQLQGLGVHWELQGLASGGMPLHDLLRVGTIIGAESIGHAKDFGSLEPGKLADLQVLDKNPLLDIKNTLSIRYVMKNGRLYEAATLNEIWPRTQPLPIQWWQEDR